MERHDTVTRKDPLLTLIAGILGPPVIWAVRIGASYILVPPACTANLIWLLHALTVAALVATAGLGIAAWRQRRGTAHIPSARPQDAGDPTDVDRLHRIRFMAVLGTFSSAIFSLVIIAEGLANVVLDPCQTSGPLQP